MGYVCDVFYAVLYVCVNCFVEHGCAVSNVCNIDVFAKAAVTDPPLIDCVVLSLE